MPDGELTTRMVATDTRRPKRGELLSRISMTAQGAKRAAKQKRQILSRGNATKAGNILETGGASMKPFIEAGAVPMEGFQLRYIYFIDSAYRARLTVPELPYSAIDEAGARMYKGERAGG